MSNRAKALQNLYNHGRISIGALRQAVMDGTLTVEEFKIITGEDYES